jgi:hypothetical protein
MRQHDEMCVVLLAMVVRMHFRKEIDDAVGLTDQVPLLEVCAGGRAVGEMAIFWRTVSRHGASSSTCPYCQCVRTNPASGWPLDSLVLPARARP